MISRHTVERLTSLRGHILITAVGLALLIAGTASPALATPTGPYAVFAQCPTEIPSVTICTFSQTTSGEVSIGNTKVPINKTLTLQGGGVRIARNTYALLPAKNGESL